MNFFEHQAAAKKKTRQLIWLFAGSLLLTSVALYGVTLWGLTQIDGRAWMDWPIQQHAWVFGGLTLGVSLIILMGSSFKLWRLSRIGGQGVAESVGGRLIDPGTTDAVERKILNIVEEVALASGMSVPPIYLLDQEVGINAFAAGNTPATAVVAVTRGCVERLSRDELQGVVAHEFSHILNGDMRMNMKLMGVLHGLLMISYLGYFILRGSSGRSHERSERSSSLPFFLFGLAVVVIGYIGRLAGKMIQAAICRQREYLADASAVQFTRQPEGIVGALAGIAENQQGAQLDNGHAAEVSHMFFAQGTVFRVANKKVALPQVFSKFSGYFATHPPLGDRIRRIIPQWDGHSPLRSTQASALTNPPVDGQAAANTQNEEEQRQRIMHSLMAGAAVAAGGANLEAADMSGVPGAPGGALIDTIGQPNAAQLQTVQTQMKKIPDDVLAMAHEGVGAELLLYQLLLDQDEAVRTKQWAYLKEQLDPMTYAYCETVSDQVPSMDSETRFVTLGIAIAALRSMALTDYHQCVQRMWTLIEADGKVDLIEWVIGRLVRHDVGLAVGAVRVPAIKYYDDTQVASAYEVLLSMLAYVGHHEPEQQQAAFDQGAAPLHNVNITLQPREACRLSQLDEAVEMMEQADPLLKQRIIEAAARVIGADGEVSEGEAVLFRAIGSVLDCPVPPLLPGQKLV